MSRGRSVWVGSVSARSMAIAASAFAALCLIAPSAEAQFPRSILGYSFDASPERSCVSAGGVWLVDATGDWARCNVVPDGRAGRSAITFCRNGWPCTLSIGVSGAQEVADRWNEVVRPIIEASHFRWRRALDACTRAFVEAPAVERATCTDRPRPVREYWHLGAGMLLISLFLGHDGELATLTVTFVSPRNETEFRVAGGRTNPYQAIHGATDDLADEPSR